MSNQVLVFASLVNIISVFTDATDAVDAVVTAAYQGRAVEAIECEGEWLVVVGERSSIRSGSVLVVPEQGSYQQVASDLKYFLSHCVMVERGGVIYGLGVMEAPTSH